MVFRCGVENPRCRVTDEGVHFAVAAGVCVSVDYAAGFMCRFEVSCLGDETFVNIFLYSSGCWCNLC